MSNSNYSRLSIIGHLSVHFRTLGVQYRTLSLANDGFTITSLYYKRLLGENITAVGVKSS